jgi:hypothetical protein
MSYRKKVLIQERNILLEKKYILEQAPPPPPPPPVQGTTPPVPAQGGTPPPAPVPAPPPVTTTTTTQPLKITKDFYDKLRLCSAGDNPKNPIKIQTEFGVVLKDSHPESKLPYCKMGEKTFDKKNEIVDL